MFILYFFSSVFQYILVNSLTIFLIILRKQPGGQKILRFARDQRQFRHRMEGRLAMAHAQVPEAATQRQMQNTLNSNHPMKCPAQRSVISRYVKSTNHVIGRLKESNYDQRTDDFFLMMDHVYVKLAVSSVVAYFRVRHF